MDDITINNEYKLWIQDIGTRFKRSQIKAATVVNSEMLMFYWGIGADIVKNKNLFGYGSSFYDKLSIDLKEILPEVKSFSPRNLRYMAAFYDMYKDVENLQQLVANSEIANIFLIPWGHHIQILTKCKGDRNKALFFVNKTVTNNWSRNTLFIF